MENHNECSLSESQPSPPARLSQQSGGRHGARNNNKMKLFVKWLQQHFPEAFGTDDNGECRPILDVAGGGKGELAARLAWCCQRRVTIVDPRPTNVVQCLQKHVLPQLPKKWQARASLYAQEAEQRGVSPFAQLDEMVKQHQTYFTHQSALPGHEANASLAEAIENACLLVGMHADSATEAIVDAALYYQKPFVVVPCCVFPNLFPHRTMIAEHSDIIVLSPVGTNGDLAFSTLDKQLQQTNLRMLKVRSYEDFCHYLLSKDPRFKSSVLPFPGRNLAIWWDGC